MRSDDIRRMVIDANMQALEKVTELQAAPINQDEVAAYREQLETTLEFWRSASPGFIHAWFKVTGS
jgi:hypothetical protein